MEIISKYYDSEIGTVVKVLKPTDPRSKIQKRRPYPLLPRPSYIKGPLWPRRAQSARPHWVSGHKHGGIITNNY